MSENKKWEHKKSLDELDNILIHLVSIGGDTCTYLTNTLGQPKHIITNRVRRLTEMGLLDSVDNQEKYIYRKYKLTEKGQKQVNSLNLLANIVLLHLK